MQADGTLSVYLHCAHACTKGRCGPLADDALANACRPAPPKDIPGLLSMVRPAPERRTDNRLCATLIAGCLEIYDRQAPKEEHGEAVSIVMIAGSRLQLSVDRILGEPVVAVAPLTYLSEEDAVPLWKRGSWLLWPPKGVTIQEVLLFLWQEGAAREDFPFTFAWDGEALFKSNFAEIRTARRIAVTGASGTNSGSGNSEIAPSSLAAGEVGSRALPRVRVTANGELQDTGAGRELILGKVTSPPFSSLQIQREATMLIAAQGHPNVIPFLGLYLLRTGPQASWAIAQVYCDGGDLFELMSRNGVFQEPNALRMMNDVAKGLAHIHAQQIVHRDIKAENVVSKDSVYILADFGNAAFNSDRKAMSDRRGTVGYIAPEMLLNDFVKVSYPIDVFSSGVLLYYVLSFKMPFGAGKKDPDKTCRATILAKCKFNKNPYFDFVEQRTKTLIERMCARMPTDRPTMADIVRTTVPVTERRRPPPPRRLPPGETGAASSGAAASSSSSRPPAEETTSLDEATARGGASSSSSVLAPSTGLTAAPSPMSRKASVQSAATAGPKSTAYSAASETSAVSELHAQKKTVDVPGERASLTSAASASSPSFSFGNKLKPPGTTHGTTQGEYGAEDSARVLSPKMAGLCISEHNVGFVELEDPFKAESRSPRLSVHGFSAIGSVGQEGYLLDHSTLWEESLLKDKIEKVEEPEFRLEQVLQAMEEEQKEKEKQKEREKEKEKEKEFQQQKRATGISGTEQKQPDASAHLQPSSSSSMTMDPAVKPERFTSEPFGPGTSDQRVQLKDLAAELATWRSRRASAPSLMCPPEQSDMAKMATLQTRFLSAPGSVNQLDVLVEIPESPPASLEASPSPPEAAPICLDVGPSSVADHQPLAVDGVDAEDVGGSLGVAAASPTAPRLGRKRPPPPVRRGGPGASGSSGSGAPAAEIVRD
eukprot:TRINITY_DN7107_c0_g3_i1.p1 TRINITY_DN7107_c0_g3~~TRINITY_DN7107_c0_g3_i1.p1  ORF type:complete len:960 (-),score=153.81 TRINITY_DN7107_c0_g3_i1:67-2883(-)